MSYINITKIRDIVSKSSIVKEAAVRAVQKQFNLSKNEMLAEFDESPVSEEIKEGEDADNITETLSQYKGDVHGNLFAFLGFEQGSDPVGDLRKFIDNSSKLNTTPVIRQDTGVIHFRFVGQVPTAEDIKRATPLPWGGNTTSRSWVAIIEDGTNTFSYYLYKLYSIDNPPSRSTRAVQAKITKGPNKGQLVQVQTGTFQTTEYTTEIIRNFVKNVGTSSLL